MKIFAILSSCLFAMVSAETYYDDSPACQKFKEMLDAWGAGDLAGMAATVSNPIRHSYDPRISPDTPSLLSGNGNLTPEEFAAWGTQIAASFEYRSIDTQCFGSGNKAGTKCTVVYREKAANKGFEELHMTHIIELDDSGKVAQLDQVQISKNRVAGTHKTAVQLVDAAFKALGAGDIPLYRTLFADDAALIWNFNPTSPFPNGRKEFGKDGWSFEAFLEMLGTMEFFDMQHQDFGFPADDNQAGYIGTFHFREKATGKRFRSKFLCVCETKDGKIISARHDELYGSTQDIGANALVENLYDVFKAGDADGINAAVHEDAVTVYTGGLYDAAGISATNNGRDAFWKFMGTVAEHADYHYGADGKVAVDYQRQHVSADGKSAVFSGGLPYTRKSDGGQYYDRGYSRWQFDNFGKLTFHEWHVTDTVQTHAPPSSSKKEL